MLTKTDLSQIREVIKEELKNHPTKSDLANELKNHPTKIDLAKTLNNHPTKEDLARELKPVKQDIAQIRKDVKAIVSFFDREYVELRRRVEQIEHHLGIAA